MTTKLKPITSVYDPQLVENLLAWSAALRSGEYKQGYGALKAQEQYCCVGVLCGIAQLLHFVSDRGDGVTFFCGEGERAPQELTSYIPLPHNNVSPTNDWWGIFYTNNDGKGGATPSGGIRPFPQKSFDEIADFIDWLAEGVREAIRERQDTSCFDEEMWIMKGAKGWDGPQ